MGRPRLGATESGNISSMAIAGVTVSGVADAGKKTTRRWISTWKSAPLKPATTITVTSSASSTPNSSPEPAMSPSRPLNGWVSAADWTISTEDVEIAIEDMRMEDLGGRRPMLPILARADEFYIAEMERGEEPDPVELVELIARDLRRLPPRSDGGQRACIRCRRV